MTIEVSLIRSTSHTIFLHCNHSHRSIHGKHLIHSQSFVGKFKIAEQALAHRKQAHVLSPLLFDTFDPHDQSK